MPRACVHADAEGAAFGTPCSAKLLGVIDGVGFMARRCESSVRPACGSLDPGERGLGCPAGSSTEGPIGPVWETVLGGPAVFGAEAFRSRHEGRLRFGHLSAHRQDDQEQSLAIVGTADSRPADSRTTAPDSEPPI
jgi:hypothetical protein